MNSPLRILYLEDDPKDSDLVQAMLGGGGFACDVTRVETRVDFCASLEQCGFDLILADYTLPSFDGISALKIAVEKRPEVPFIFVSGTLDEEIAIEALKIGATDYVFKTRLSRIIPALQRALREGQDRAERQRTQEALQRSEAYLAEAQRLSHTGSWASIPASGEIRYLSEECYRVLGFEPHGGQPKYEMFFQRIHPDDRANVREAAETAGREKAEFELDYRIVHPGGEIRDVHVVGHPVPSPSGDLVEFVGTVIDITERKRAEEERERLRQAQADLAHVNRVTTMGELTASVAHEVNQPIAAAVTNANTCIRWLAGSTPNVEEARAAAMRIVKDGTRAAEIVSRIRALFKKGATPREWVDVNEVIREMVVLLHTEALRYSISFRTDLAADLPRLMADRVQLQQVLLNLMVNSVDAMKGTEGTRELSIKSQRAENEEILVSFSDTGVGLPQQQVDQIFHAFFTTKVQGTGMGLSISRSIIESHGGRLWATGKSGRGATFQFTLPTTVEAHKLPEYGDPNSLRA